MAGWVAVIRCRIFGRVVVFIRGIISRGFPGVVESDCNVIIRSRGKYYWEKWHSGHWLDFEKFKWDVLWFYAYDRSVWW